MVDDGGGELVDIFPEDFNAYIYDIQKPTTKVEFDNIISNQDLSIEFNIDGVTNIKGIRESIKRNVKTGMTEFILKSKQKIEPNGN